MALMGRRSALKHVAGGLAATTHALAFTPNRVSASWAEDEITPSEREAMAKVAATFMDTFEVPGLSIAIARRGHLVYQQPLGMANRETGEKVSTSHLFRIASVTKPLTSVAIFSLSSNKARFAVKTRFLATTAFSETSMAPPRTDPMWRTLPSTICSRIRVGDGTTGQAIRCLWTPCWITRT